ncbi:hypothetical protein SAY87_022339 [Trapa incisa]|uniref:Uncharacterized protein n=1 Tax=Trapa incisa TaxID=236973 RepID=A0AAN7K0U8_9MYRT|nr:hypothetical protein SAY87_022339 [Trapa incisa]
MVSLETIQSISRSTDSTCATPRISFSADHCNGNSSSSAAFISLATPTPQLTSLRNLQRATSEWYDTDKTEFEFLSAANSTLYSNILTADELFSEGKLLPFWQAHHSNNRPTCSATAITSGTSPGPAGVEGEMLEKGHRAAARQVADECGSGRTVSVWYMDDDLSPRPPKCTVLWKELLRLRNRPIPSTEVNIQSHERREAASGGDGGGGSRNRDKGDVNKRVNKGLERTRSGSLRIRPMINVPICSTLKGTTTSSSSTYALYPPLFPTKKGRLER